MCAFIHYEKRYYVVEDTFHYLSRRQGQQILEPYLSAVIDDLSSVTIELSEDSQKLLLDTVESLSRLDAHIKGKLVMFPMLLLRTEALSSSQIEHYSSSNKNVALAQINASKSKEALIIKSNLDTLIHALSTLGQLDLDKIVDLNRILLSNPQIGIRKRINWIGKPNSIPHEAAYVPPHPEYLNQYMSQFIVFCQRNDIHPLIQAAFAHAYFEIIHPFEDGNGRVGRIIIQRLLKEKLFLEHVNLPFSLGIVKDQVRYVQALDDFKEGKYESIIQVLLENALSVIPRVYEILEKLTLLKQTWKDKLSMRQDAFAWKMLDDFIGQPVFDVKYYKEKYGVNDQAIRNNLEVLIKAGIISTDSNRKRDMIYEAKEVLDILDEFIL